MSQSSLPSINSAEPLETHKTRMAQSFYDAQEVYQDRASRVAICLRETLENTLAWREGDKSVVRAITAQHPLLGKDVVYLFVAMKNKPFTSMRQLLSIGLLPLQSGEGVNSLRGCGLVVSSVCSSPERKSHLFIASKIDGKLRAGKGYLKDGWWKAEEFPLAADVITGWCGPETLKNFNVFYAFPFPRDIDDN